MSKLSCLYLAAVLPITLTHIPLALAQQQGKVTQNASVGRHWPPTQAERDAALASYYAKIAAERARRGTLALSNTDKAKWGPWAPYMNNLISRISSKYDAKYVRESGWLGPVVTFEIDYMGRQSNIQMTQPGTGQSGREASKAIQEAAPFGAPDLKVLGQRILQIRYHF